MKQSICNQKLLAGAHSKSKILLRFQPVQLLLTICFLAACSGQGTSSPETTELSAQTIPQTLKAEKTGLLASLALEYPNGQLPADRAGKAAEALSQNPSVFKNAAVVASKANALTENLQTQVYTAADFKRVYRIQNTSLPGSYFFTIYTAEKDAALAANPNWNLEGTAFYTLPAASTDLKPVYRFRNKMNGSYLYTAFESEKTAIETNYGATYVLEGVAWRAQQTESAGFSPLHRFRNLTNGTYLNTAFETEKDAIIRDYSAIFEYEGIAYYVLNTNPVPACTAAVNGTTGYSLVFKGCDAENVAVYYDKTECVRDNATGLIWEGKSTSGLRRSTRFFNNFDDTTKLQGYTQSSTGSPATNDLIIIFTPSRPSQSQIDSYYDVPSDSFSSGWGSKSGNSIGYANAVKASGLCGFTDWRRPATSELMSLVKAGSTPTIDAEWFPNSVADKYWTGSADSNESSALVVNFYSGTSGLYSRQTSAEGYAGERVYLRLVR